MNLQEGTAQILAKDHPLLVKQLTMVLNDTAFKNKENSILDEAFSRGYNFYNYPLESGKVCFTTEDCQLKFGTTFIKSKSSNTLLSKGSMVWIVGHERIYDSVKINNEQYLYFWNYRVYVPSLKKNAFMNAKYLPDFCISTRGYTNLDTLKPQQVRNFQQYHSLFINVPRLNDKAFVADSNIQVNDLITNWIQTNDRIFQIYLRHHPDSSQLQINIQTGIVNSQNTLNVDAQNATPHLGARIFPWVYGSRGLMGNRNVIEIEHWAESCGQEGGSTFFTFMEQPEQSTGLTKLGDFHCISEGGVFSLMESLIFPADTFSNFFAPGNLNYQITGKPNYLIQYNITCEFLGWDEIETAEYTEESKVIENEVESKIEEDLPPNTKTKTETQYSKWNRNPMKFKKIQYVDPCKVTVPGGE